MTTIVVNTKLGAVTEYDWSLTSVSPNHATSTAGLLTFSGDTDDGANINAAFLSGKEGGTVKRNADTVFFAIEGTGTGILRVKGDSTEWQYSFDILTEGVSRAQPGRGIRENYLSYGFRNVDGANFKIDRIDTGDTGSNNRRT